eukprot:jgi/Botrbrau1/15232/Bobra.0149s0085.1
MFIIFCVAILLPGTRQSVSANQQSPVHGLLANWQTQGDNEDYRSWLYPSNAAYLPPEKWEGRDEEDILQPSQSGSLVPATSASTAKTIGHSSNARAPKHRAPRDSPTSSPAGDDAPGKDNMPRYRMVDSQLLATGHPTPVPKQANAGPAVPVRVPSQGGPPELPDAPPDTEGEDVSAALSNGIAPPTADNGGEDESVKVEGPFESSGSALAPDREPLRSPRGRARGPSAAQGSAPPVASGSTAVRPTPSVPQGISLPPPPAVPQGISLLPPRAASDDPASPRRASGAAGGLGLGGPASLREDRGPSRVSKSEGSGGPGGPSSSGEDEGPSGRSSSGGTPGLSSPSSLLASGGSGSGGPSSSGEDGGSTTLSSSGESGGPSGPSSPLGSSGPGGPSSPEDGGGPGGPSSPGNGGGPGGPSSPEDGGGPGGPSSPSSGGGPSSPEDGGSPGGPSYSGTSSNSGPSSPSQEYEGESPSPGSSPKPPSPPDDSRSAAPSPPPATFKTTAGETKKGSSSVVNGQPVPLTADQLLILGFSLRPAEDQQCPANKAPSLLQPTAKLSLGRRLRGGDTWPPEASSAADVAPPYRDMDTRFHTGGPTEIRHPPAADVAPPYGGGGASSLTEGPGRKRRPGEPPAGDGTPPWGGGGIASLPGALSSAWRPGNPPGGDLAPPYVADDIMHLTAGSGDTWPPGPPSDADVAPPYVGDAETARRGPRASVSSDRLFDVGFVPAPHPPDSSPAADKWALQAEPEALWPALHASTLLSSSGLEEAATSAVPEESQWLPQAATLQGAWLPGGPAGASRHLQQSEEPDVKKRSPPSPPQRLCDYGDPFRKPQEGGCCEACRLAAQKYTHFKDSDLVASTTTPRPPTPPPLARPARSVPASSMGSPFVFHLFVYSFVFTTFSFLANILQVVWYGLACSRAFPVVMPLIDSCLPPPAVLIRLPEHMRRSSEISTVPCCPC